MEIEVVKHIYLYEVVKRKSFWDMLLNHQNENLGKIAYTTYNSRFSAVDVIGEKICNDLNISFDYFVNHFYVREVEHTMKVVLCTVDNIEESYGMCLPYIVK